MPHRAYKIITKRPIYGPTFHPDRTGPGVCCARQWRAPELELSPRDARRYSLQAGQRPAIHYAAGTAALICGHASSERRRLAQRSPPAGSVQYSATERYKLNTIKAASSMIK